MNHKYGFHVNRPGGDVLDAVKRIKPKVLKGVEHDVGFWREVRSVVPDAFVIGRLVVTPEEQDRFVHDPAGTGRAFAERILRLEANSVTVGGRPLFDAWESYNEVFPGNSPADLKRAYDEFQVAFAEPIKQAGFEPVAMNFGTGNLVGSDYLEFFTGTLETYKYLGFHEYDWPDMWRLHRQNIEEKGEEGMWLTLRYRRTMREVRSDERYRDRHTAIITECGMTQGVLGGEDVGPWHKPTLPRHVLEELKLDPDIGEGRYWQSLIWYNDELMKDDYVMAALLFVVGAISPWESFEHLGGIVGRLEAFQKSEALAPTPVEPEMPEPGEPEPEEPEPAASFEETLLAEAARKTLIKFNPRAALQRQIFADGFVPNSPEFEVEYGGRRYVAQAAEHLGTGEVRVYHVQEGDWANVAHVRQSA